MASRRSHPEIERLRRALNHALAMGADPGRVQGLEPLVKGAAERLSAEDRPQARILRQLAMDIDSLAAPRPTCSPSRPPPSPGPWP